MHTYFCLSYYQRVGGVVKEGLGWRSMRSFEAFLWNKL